MKTLSMQQYATSLLKKMPDKKKSLSITEIQPI